MEHREPIPLHTANIEELDGVAARIRPLPSDVRPSPEFMSRTRLRLLQLPSIGDEDRERRAA